MLNINYKIIFFIILFIILPNANAKYLDTQSCKECHEMIHYEHTTSMHHNSSLFKDEFHNKVKNLTSKDKYDCALCHTPNASNLRAIIIGEEKVNKNDTKTTDGVSCFYCHQITKVLELKHKNINFYSYKENSKPNFLAYLDDVSSSDKHNNGSNEIFHNSQVCMGCHGKKYNKNDVEICNGYNEIDEKSDCISCHMKKFPGGVTKLNKKGRTQYSSHEFLGIRDQDMVKKAVELKLGKIDNTHIKLIIKNKMGHSIIMQPMRLKFVQTIIVRGGKVIWKNYAKNPIEDTEATFTRIFNDDQGKSVLPPFAKGILYDNNIKANKQKIIIYKTPSLKKSDIVTSTWISYVARPTLAKKLNLTNSDLLKKYIGIKSELIIK